MTQAHEEHGAAQAQAQARRSQRRSLATLVELLATPDLPPLVWRVGHYNELMGKVAAVGVFRATAEQQEATWNLWVAALSATAEPEVRPGVLSNGERILKAVFGDYGPNHTHVIIWAAIDTQQDEL